jgi:hypothetical protein
MGAAHTFLHPYFGPDPGGYPYGLPYDIVTSVQPAVTIAFSYASESDPGPYPFGPGTPIEGGPGASGDRHAIMVNKSTRTLFELWDAHYFPGAATAGSARQRLPGGGRVLPHGQPQLRPGQRQARLPHRLTALPDRLTALPDQLTALAGGPGRRVR